MDNLQATVSHLQLERPLVFIDLETTGLNVNSDRIVELSVLKINPDGSQESKSIRLNPGIHIPSEATDIHGISDDDVVDKPLFKQYAKSLMVFFDECDVAGFGIQRFDLPLLKEEFSRIGLVFSYSDRHVIDAQTIFFKMEPRDLTAAYNIYCGKDLTLAHTADADVVAAAEVLDAQIGRYPDLPGTIQELAKYCDRRQPNWLDDDGRLKWSDGEVVFGFGKYLGRGLKEIVGEDRDYLFWILGTNFSDQFKELVSHGINGQYPVQESTDDHQSRNLCH